MKQSLVLLDRQDMAAESGAQAEVHRARRRQRRRGAAWLCQWPPALHASAGMPPTRPKRWTSVGLASLGFRVRVLG